MRLSRQYQACLFFFFFTKRFCAHKKHQNAKQTTFTLLEDFARIKNVAFVVFYSLVFVLLVNFCLSVFFYAQDFFVKKK